MILGAPEWLLLAPILALVGGYWRALGLGRPLRLVCCALLVLVLADPRVRLLKSGLDLWVLVDRSASVGDTLERHLAEWEDLLARGRRHDDRLRYVDFAAEVAERGDDEGARYAGGRDLTRTALAIRHVLARLSRDRASRLLLLTDGYATEPLDGLEDRLVAERVALDYRLATQPSAIDYRVERFAVPIRTQPAEPFLVELDVVGPPEGEVQFQIRRDGTPVHTARLALTGGRGRVRLTDRLVRGGAYRYEVAIAGDGDVHPGNDRAARWIEVTAGPRVVLATSYADDPLAARLETLGMTVDVVTDVERLSVGRLTGARAVILDNVPAWRLPREVLEGLDFYVREQGGGLLMAGGRQSFGTGGYFDSPVADLLPVSMEQRQQHRKLAVAMAIVLDRSGSMSAAVPGPHGSTVTKIQLADEGVARTIDLLGDQDLLTVIAVDSEPHDVVPLGPVGERRVAIASTVRRIDSGGGGIFVYTGLKAAWDVLAKTTAGLRHVILFADAADAEEPEGATALVTEMTKGGATLSVIALGQESDKDAAFLRDLATRGGGRIFFAANAADLPSLFAQETVAVARSTFVDEPVGVTPTADWLELAARPLDWPAEVDAYNLSYLRPEAAAAAVGADDDAAPLVAFWRRGAGRVATVSFPLAGELSARVRSWPAYGDFVQTLGRWLAGEDVPPGIALWPRLDGTELVVDLFHDEAWAERFTAAPPRLVVAEGTADAGRPVAWERLGPGHYASRLSLVPNQPVRGVVQAGGVTLPFGPIVAGSDVEWAFDPERVHALEHLSAASGGSARLNLGDVWSAPRPARYGSIRPWLLATLLLAFLAEVLATRLGWRAPEIAWPRRPRREPVPADEPRAPSRAAPPVAPTSIEDDAEAERRRRFRRAKR